jgi:hypothetical protein
MSLGSLPTGTKGLGRVWAVRGMIEVCPVCHMDLASSAPSFPLSLLLFSPSSACSWWWR